MTQRQRAQQEDNQGAENLETFDGVENAIIRELHKLDAVSRRLASLKKQYHGYYRPMQPGEEFDEEVAVEEQVTDDGTRLMVFVPGTQFRIAAIRAEFIRDLWHKCHDPSKRKEDRPKWPGEDARDDMLDEKLPLELKAKDTALKNEINVVEEYGRITEKRLIGMQSLLKRHLIEAEQSARWADMNNQVGVGKE